MLRFFNTLTRRLEEFKPSGSTVRLYTCGPTVYDYAHIGNFRTYVFEDLLRRFLIYKGYKIKQVMNLTDVDDKTISSSRKKNISIAEFTQKYIDAFFDDLKKLNIAPAEVYPKATTHIQEMIKLINVLLKKDLAYVASDKSIYYSIKKFFDYGKLSHVNIKGLKAGARVKQDEYDKENASDFALWKAWNEDDGEVFWNSPFGKGRPGWHIECSAMSVKHLTKVFDNGFSPELFETIDIHTGAVDNIFPHHEDEIAQSEGVFQKRFVNYWLHSEHLLVDGNKMSKSLGNFFTLRDLLAKGYSASAIRYLLLSVHYRQKLNFTFESLDGAEQAVDKINTFMDNIRSIRVDKQSDDVVQSKIFDVVALFESALDDDLNISKALASIFDFIKEMNIELSKNNIGLSDAKEIIATFKRFDSVLGIIADSKTIPETVVALLKERDVARSKNDWHEADILRDKIKSLGFEVIDAPEGSRIKGY